MEEKGVGKALRIPPPLPPRQSGLLGAVTERGTETGELGAGCVHSD